MTLRKFKHQWKCNVEWLQMQKTILKRFCRELTFPQWIPCDCFCSPEIWNPYNPSHSIWEVPAWNTGMKAQSGDEKLRGKRAPTMEATMEGKSHWICASSLARASWWLQPNRQLFMRKWSSYEQYDTEKEHPKQPHSEEVKLIELLHPYERTLTDLP